MNLLSDTKFECRVSSTLNKNVKEFGKKFMFDGLADTCWSSDQGTPQFVQIDFKESQSLSALRIQFQGGFAPKECVLQVKTSDGTTMEEPLYPEDVNRTQDFLLNRKYESVIQLKLLFESSTDFFGRIIIYSLEIIK